MLAQVAASRCLPRHQRRSRKPWITESISKRDVEQGVHLHLLVKVHGQQITTAWRRFLPVPQERIHEGFVRHSLDLPVSQVLDSGGDVQVISKKRLVDRVDEQIVTVTAGKDRRDKQFDST